MRKIISFRGYDKASNHIIYRNIPKNVSIDESYEKNKAPNQAQKSNENCSKTKCDPFVAIPPEFLPPTTVEYSHLGWVNNLTGRIIG